MSLTRAEAIDEMLTVFHGAWSPTGHPVKYDNVGAISPPPTTTSPWARVVLRHATSEQATLSGVAGNRRFRRSGSITVQIFTPVGEGLPSDEDLPKIVQDAYEGVTTPGGVIFRSVAISEIGSDREWFQVNVVASFEYDEIK